MTLQSFSGQSAPTVTAKDFRAVLVVGGDAIADQLVERLSAEGFSIVYIGSPEPRFAAEKYNGKIECIPNGVLKAIHGVIGEFHASIQTPSDFFQRKVGFVVVAQPPKIVPKYEAYGVKPANKVMRLSRFLEQLQGGAPRALEEADQLHVAFFAGLDNIADTTTFAKIFDCIDILIRGKGVQCYVFTRHLKVAENGLEARYRSAREAGTLFFAFEGAAPAVEQTDDTVKILFEEPHLSSEFELIPDILVLDEWLLPPDAVEPVCAMIPSSLRSVPFLTPASPRFPTVETAKAGVFALGPARGEFYPAKISEDIESVAASLKKLTTPIKDRGPTFVAAVEPAKCTLCLTCVRTCPHGAIQFATSALVDENSCQGCGICVSECPMHAIALAERKTSPPCNSEEERRLAPAPESAGKLVAFLCAHSGANAFAELPRALKAHVTPIVVPCAGAVRELDIAQALLDGAHGVLVAGCFHGNCASVYGTDRAAYRVASMQRAIAETGFDKNRLMFVPSASNAPYTLASAIEELLGLKNSPTQDSPAASVS